MKLEEFVKRNLTINEYGKIYDKELNEYRNEKGEIEFLEATDLKIFYIWRIQHEDIKEGLLRGNLK